MGKIGCYGKPGAYTFIATKALFPTSEVLHFLTFKECFVAVEDGVVDAAVIPIENSQAGRVTPVYRLMETTPLFCLQEYFQKIEHCLLAPPTATLESIKTVYSHEMALAQCNVFLNKYNYERKPSNDTAGSAEFVSKLPQTEATSCAAIASASTADLYGLKILKRNVEDTDDNVTRFVVISNTQVIPKYEKDKSYMTCVYIDFFNTDLCLYDILDDCKSNNFTLYKIDTFTSAKFLPCKVYLELGVHCEAEEFKRFLSKNTSIKHKLFGCIEISSHRIEGKHLI